MLHLAFAAGLRVSGLVGLRLDDITLQPQPAVHVRGKGRRERVLPLWKTTAKALCAWLALRGGAVCPELFLNARRGALTRDGFEHILAKHVQVATTTMPSLKQKRVSPHVLRHPCAMHTLEATRDIRKVAPGSGTPRCRRQRSTYAPIRPRSSRPSTRCCHRLFDAAGSGRPTSCSPHSSLREERMIMRSRRADLPSKLALRAALTPHNVGLGIIFLCGPPHNRNAWLFFGSGDHAQAAANIFSLIASCVLHRLDAEGYLADVIRVLPYWPRDRYLELTPKYWLRTRARLVESEMKLAVGHVTVPPLSAEQQSPTH